ncbi:IS3 family transposase [Streptomyces sp. NPDC051662]|uniref:IS3 family transposase n=1 Tax=Streptomyces sp. NPDC051662 TaxID=3154750 RepID=UPI003418FC83
MLGARAGFIVTQLRFSAVRGEPSENSSKSATSRTRFADASSPAQRPARQVDGVTQAAPPGSEPVRLVGLRSQPRPEVDGSLILGRKVPEEGAGTHSRSTGSFFASMETELIDRTAVPTRHHAEKALFACIEGFYDTRRRHSANGQLSPAEYERRHSATRTTTLHAAA